ncbi:MAG: hypothetical protein MRY32_03620 [Rickettsiales bacterium]|nr:hypothetical protein [Rickettsiales bacterium]
MGNGYVKQDGDVTVGRWGNRIRDVNEETLAKEAEMRRQIRNECARPISVIDTCSLSNLMSGHMRMTGHSNKDYLHRAKDGPNGHPEDPIALLEWLSDTQSKPPRTLIIPNEVLREFFVMQDGYTLGIHKNDSPQGPAFDFDFDEDEHRFKYANAYPLAHYLDDQKSGVRTQDESAGLRCYGSVKQMLEAGELSHPKGGVVIVECTEKSQTLRTDGVYTAYRPHDQTADNGVRSLSKRLGLQNGGIHFPWITGDRGITIPGRKEDEANPRQPFVMNLRALITSLTGDIEPDGKPYISYASSKHAKGPDGESALFKAITPPPEDRPGDRKQAEDIYRRRSDTKISTERRDEQIGDFDQWLDAVKERQAIIDKGGRPPGS